MELTKEQIKEFIFAQPDERPIKMGEISATGKDDRCGCLLIHLFRHYYPDYKGCIEAGFAADVKSNDDNIKLNIKTPHILHFLGAPDLSIERKSNYKTMKAAALTW